MKRKLLSMAIGLFAMVQSSFAVPAYPYPITVTQPDGSEITIQIKGDEFFNYKLTLDGLHIAQRSDGFYYYYTPDMDAQGTRVEASNFMRASDPADRTEAEKNYIRNFAGGVSQEYMMMGQEAAKIKRNIRDNAVNDAQFAPTRAGRHLPERGICLLAQFTDVRFNSDHTRETFDRILNEKGYDYNGAIGSVSDYYSQNSNGAYNPTFEVADIVTLPNDMAYYGGNAGASGDKRPDQMIRDACEAADPYVNFKDFDTDGDGEIDNVFVYYAGYNEAEGASSNTIWPHRWRVYPQNVSGTTTFDGVELGWYACTSELKGRSGNTVAGIGTFSHEFGHALGLPDFYDTDGPTNGTSVGLYNVSIMCSGSYNSNGNIPPTYSAVERNMLGWLEFKDITEQDGQVVKNYPVSDDRACTEAWIIPTEEPKEFFVIESRGNNVWDAPLIGSGMLIYQWDKSGNYESLFAQNSINNNASHPRVRFIESAGGILSSREVTLSQIGYPGQKNRVTFQNGDYGFKSWGGVELPVSLTDITDDMGTVSFYVSSNGAAGELKVRLVKQRTAEVKFVSPSGTWYVRSREADGEWSKFEKQTEDVIQLTSLEPNTKYEVEARMDENDSEGSVVEAFRTLPVTEITSAIEGVYGEYSVGETFYPSVTNLTADYSSVSWEIDGASVSTTSYYTFNVRGTFILTCTINYADGSKEVLTKTLVVK